jgi:hypothetical protein
LPLNRLPDYISSNISLTGVSADYLDGIDLSVISSSLRANRAITGGGTITFDVSGNLIWSDRFMVMSNGRSTLTAPQGYFDIYMPPAGTTITGLGGASSRTVSASGITIGGWESLYYILPTGISQVTNNNNFRIVSYTVDVNIPHDWVLLATRNGDVSNQYLYLNNGIVLAAGQSDFAGRSRNVFVGASNTENYIAFRGTTGDGPGDFNHGYIGERLYGGAEQSELLLFKGNDVDLSSGLDRIRLLAAGHRFDTYSTGLSGTFAAVGAAATTTRMSIDTTGVSLPRLNFSGGTSTITAQTLADGTISFDSTAGQLFSISNSLTGTIFAINDISGLPSFEVTDLGIIKLNELYGQTVIGSGTPATSAQLSSIARTSATIPLVVRGAASQSVNLQEWQNSTPTTVASISNTGAITAVDLTLSGNLTVNGTTTNINTTNLVVEDKNIILGDVTTPSNTTADGGGITLKGATDKTFNWVNSTGYWTSNVGVEASSFVKTSGTSAQFLKADGSVDASTYLTTGTAASTYLTTSTASSTYAPINNPTFTGNVTAPLFRVGSAPYYQYETQVGGGTDLGFKKLATITLPTGLYTGLSFYIEVIEVGGNFGNTAASTKSVYFASAIRSGGTQDDSMSMTLTGPSTNRYLQGVKVDSATYEIQVRAPGNYNHLIVRGFGISGLNSSVVWSNATVAGSTGIATYTPTSGNNNWFGNIKFWGTLSKDGGTSAQFLKADGTVDSTTYAPLASPSLTGTPLSTTAAVDTNTTQIATTAFVVAQASGSNPLALGTVAQGTSLRYSRQDHVHPTTGLALLAGATFTGAVGSTFTGGTAHFTSTNTSNLNTEYNLLLVGANDTGSKAIHFVNSSTRSTDGGVNAYTIRNDGGILNLGNASFQTNLLGSSIVSTTAAVDTNTTHIATTAFVIGQASAVTPAALGTAAVGSSTRYARADHVHSNTADQFIASNNGNGTNFRVGDDVWLGDIDVANTMSVRGLQSAASGFIRFGSDTNPLGYNGTTFSYGGTFNAAAITTSGALALNYASPAITSNNASAASIFTSTVTGVTIGSSTIKSTNYPAAPSGTTSGTVTQSAQLSGYIGMPQNPQATSGTFTYTFAASDAGKHIYATGTPSSVTFTIPANTAVAFEIGTTFVVMNDLGAATNISIAITTDTMQLAGTGTTGTRTLARYGVASITKVTATKWIISGNGLT